jgi:hypothetical protein
MHARCAHHHVFLSSITLATITGCSHWLSNFKSARECFCCVALCAVASRLCCPLLSPLQWTIAAAPVSLREPLNQQSTCLCSGLCSAPAVP